MGSWLSYVLKMFRDLPLHDGMIDLAGSRSKMTMPGCWRCLSISIRKLSKEAFVAATISVMRM